jgi:hypothetical protein
MAAYERPYTPPSPQIQHMGAPTPDITSSSKPFKGKGMQLGASKNSKTHELIDQLGGADLREYTSPFAAPPVAAEPEPSPVAASPAPTAQAKENPFGDVEQEM